MYFRYPINDVHIHLFDPKDMDECTAMVDECGYTNWAFLACTVKFARLPVPSTSG